MKARAKLLVLEALEDRTLLSTCHVTRLDDTGIGGPRRDIGDLRFCINRANAAPGGPDTIQLELSGVINLSGPLPDLGSDMNIVGPGADALTVRRNTGGSYRIFTVAAGAEVHITGMTVTNGLVVNNVGGGILNRGTLTLDDVHVIDNHITNSGYFKYLNGGGIYNDGTLNVNHSNISSNGIDNNSPNVNGSWPVAYGGGIYNAGTLSVSDSTLSENRVEADGMWTEEASGGGIYSARGLFTVVGTTIASNHADWDGGGIYNKGNLLMYSSALTGNNGGQGGGITNVGTLTAEDSSFVGNSTGRGGGIRNFNGTVTVLSSTIADNTALSGSGGGIFNSGTLVVSDGAVLGNLATGADSGTGGGIHTSQSATISSSWIANNVLVGADGHAFGGGIYNDGALSVSESNVSGNLVTLTEDGPIHGGGIYNAYGARMTISDSIVSANHLSLIASGDGISTAHGGGIYTESIHTTTISRCTIADNQVLVRNYGISHARGGGVFHRNGVLTIQFSTIRDNSIKAEGPYANLRAEGGGVAAFNNASLTIDSSTISGNAASGSGLGSIVYASGGGIHAYEPAFVTVINSTITGNAVSSNSPYDSSAGGGTYFVDLIEHSTIAFNTVDAADDADARGGGVYGGGVHGSIVAHNWAASGWHDMGSANGSQGHNVIGYSGGHSYHATDVLDVDPLLGPLQDNGGPTLTMALLPGSPAIDAGDNADAPEFDQRGPGFARIVNDTIDIGASEVQSTGAPRQPDFLAFLITADSNQDEQESIR